MNITRHTRSAQYTTPSSVCPHRPIRLVPSRPGEHHQLRTLKMLRQVWMAVPYLVIVCLRDLRGAWSSVDNHPWASQGRAAWSSTSRHLLETHRGVHSWTGIHLRHRSVTEAPVWTTSPCSVGSPLQTTHTGTCPDRAALLATRVHPLHPSQSPQVTRTGGSRGPAPGSHRAAPFPVPSLSFQRGDVCLLVMDHMEDSLTTR